MQSHELAFMRLQRPRILPPHTRALQRLPGCCWRARPRVRGCSLKLDPSTGDCLAGHSETHSHTTGAGCRGRRACGSLGILRPQCRSLRRSNPAVDTKPIFGYIRPFDASARLCGMRAQAVMAPACDCFACAAAAPPDRCPFCCCSHRTFPAAPLGNSAAPPSHAHDAHAVRHMASRAPPTRTLSMLGQPPRPRGRIRRAALQCRRPPASRPITPRRPRHASAPAKSETCRVKYA